MCSWIFWLVVLHQWKKWHFLGEHCLHWKVQELAQNLFLIHEMFLLVLNPELQVSAFWLAVVLPRNRRLCWELILNHKQFQPCLKKNIYVVQMSQVICHIFRKLFKFFSTQYFGKWNTVCCGMENWICRFLSNRSYNRDRDRYESDSFQNMGSTSRSQFPFKFGIDLNFHLNLGLISISI